LSAGSVSLEATRAVIGDVSRLGDDSSIDSRLGNRSGNHSVVNRRLRGGLGDNSAVGNRLRSRLGNGLEDKSGVNRGLGGSLIASREGLFGLGGISSADVTLSGGDVVPEVGLDGTVGDFFTDGLAIDVDGGVRGQ